jgi:hypothetical protein
MKGRVARVQAGHGSGLAQQAAPQLRCAELFQPGDLEGHLRAGRVPSGATAKLRKPTDRRPLRADAGCAFTAARNDRDW